ncbi:hypothetical protein HJFPF1_13214 [Paramyrothecium foliicola]|nr:hypothetical protein HJFPF1_13214 [Paramyrothecium foliicola]
MSNHILIVEHHKLDGDISQPSAPYPLPFTANNTHTAAQKAACITIEYDTILPTMEVAPPRRLGASRDPPTGERGSGYVEGWEEMQQITFRPLEGEDAGQLQEWLEAIFKVKFDATDQAKEALSPAVPHIVGDGGVSGKINPYNNTGEPLSEIVYEKRPVKEGKVAEGKHGDGRTYQKDDGSASPINAAT